MKYTLISLILLLCSCEQLPLYIREFKIQEAFTFDIHEPDSKPSVPQNLSELRGTHRTQGEL
jgi:hypothetical protein